MGSKNDKLNFNDLNKKKDIDSDEMDIILDEIEKIKAKRDIKLREDRYKNNNYNKKSDVNKVEKKKVEVKRESSKKIVDDKKIDTSKEHVKLYDNKKDTSKEHVKLYDNKKDDIDIILKEVKKDNIKKNASRDEVKIRDYNKDDIDIIVRKEKKVSKPQEEIIVKNVKKDNNKKKKNKRRKKRIKIIPIIITLIVMILLCVGIVYLVKYFKSEKKENNTGNTVKEPVVKKEEPKVYTASMVMVGDALIHSSVYNDANRLANYSGYDFKPQISLIKDKVKDNYDIAYYNQETILGGTALGLSDYPTFNSPQEVGDAFIDAGFNLVSLATNHTADKGKRAILASREYWNNQEGVQAVGSYSSDEEKAEIESRILEVNHIKYAMLNYTYGTNGMPVSDSYLVNVWPTDTDHINNPDSDSKYQDYKETVKRDIENLRDKVDVLMVAMHWGVEYTHKPTAYEKDMAQFLADNDVDIVIGTHPHVIQPVEWIGDTIVFYSLGNFISAQYQNQSTCTYYKCMVGLMSSLNITKTVYEGKTTIKVDNIENELIYTYYTGWRYFEIIPFSNERIKDKLSGYSDVYNTYAEIIASDDERIHTVPLVS